MLNNIIDFYPFSSEQNIEVSVGDDCNDNEKDNGIRKRKTSVSDIDDS
jgi:hypothetical protein